MDAPFWTTTFTNCEDVHVKNTKTIYNPRIQAVTLGLLVERSNGPVEDLVAVRNQAEFLGELLVVFDRAIGYIPAKTG